jgi:hypothetical protein
MANTILIGALIVVSIIAVLLWVTRPKCDMLGALEKGYELGSADREETPGRQQNWLEKLAESQDPLSAGKGGARAKPVEYNQGSNRKRPNITIASSGSKFRPKQGDGKCPAGYSEIMSGTRKGMCIKSEYARGGTPSGPSRVSGSKFSSKVNGKCPNGFSEITAGSRKGMCIKWEYAGKPSGSGRSSSPSRSSGSSGSKFISKVDGRCPAGTSEITSGGHKGQCYKGGSSGRSSSSRVSGKSGGSGSKFSQKQNGRCPAGTVEITSGGRRGQCIKTEYSSKKAGEYLSGSKFRNKEDGRCPNGTIEVTSGSRRGQCVIDDGGFKYWGWGANQGKKCRNPDNTGCDNDYGYTKPRSVDFKYWGWGANQGKKCRNPDNTGCDNSYAYTRAKPADPFPYWGWGPHAGMKCKNPNNTGCDTTFGYAKK